MSGVLGVLFQRGVPGAADKVSVCVSQCGYQLSVTSSPPFTPLREEPGSGNIITFFQFLLVAVEGGVFVTGFGSRPTHIPLSRYSIMVCFFFVVSVINNYALKFDIPLPLHMIFRAVSPPHTQHKHGSITFAIAGLPVCQYGIGHHITEETVSCNPSPSLALAQALALALAQALALALAQALA